MSFGRRPSATACSRRSIGRASSVGCSGVRRPGRNSVIPPSSWAFDPKASRPIKRDVERAAADLQGRRLEATRCGLGGARGEDALPDGAHLARSRDQPDGDGGGRGGGLGLERVRTQDDGRRTATPPNSSRRDPGGQVPVAAIDVNIGLDPDIYPLLGSTQVASGGSNFAGIQDIALDRDLIKARAPGTETARKAAYAKLQARLTAEITSCRWPSATSSWWSRVEGHRSRRSRARGRQ